MRALQIGASICAAGAAMAQSAQPSNVIEEIVVTATKREQSLLDVPLAVSAISSDEILVRGLTQYTDYINSLPGVYLNDLGPGRTDIRIRGLVVTGGLSFPVASYFGEAVTSVLTNQGGMSNPRLVDIDRVEVLRGPQGTLFGANSLSGVLRIVPNAPNLQNFEVHVGTRAFATAHSNDASYHIESAVNLPLIEDRLALRLVGYKDEIAGYIDNVVPARDSIDYGATLGLPAGLLIAPAVPAFTNKDINAEDTWGGRAALRWQATDRLRFDLTYVRQNATLESEAYIEPQVGDYLQQRELDVFTPGALEEKLDIATAVVNYDWDAASLISATSYSKMERADRQDASAFAGLYFGAPVLPWELRNDTEGKLFIQEVRLSSRGDGAIQWLFGAFYQQQESKASQLLADYSCPNCIPMLLAGQDFLLSFPTQKFFEQEQRSVFGEVSYRLTPRWTIGVGGRYLEDEIESASPDLEGVLVGGVLPGGPPFGGTNYEFNPSAYLRFKPVEELTLYLQAARGFRSGAANQVASYSGSCEDDAAQVGLGPLSEPDRLWNYELGLKSRLADGRVGLNVAVFKQEWEGVQLGSSLACGFNGTINGGDVTGEGAEVELTARATEALSLNFAAGYAHNEFDSVKPGVGFVVGERIPGAPEKNASAGAQYDFPVGAEWSGFARADYVYVGEARYKFAAVVIPQDSYSTANLRVGFQRDDLTVELFGRNVTDERAVVTTADPTVGAQLYLLRPREIGVEVRYSFKP